MNGFANRSSTSRANASAPGTSSVGTISSSMHAAHERPDERVLHRLAHRLAADEQRGRHHRRVRAVQQPHLPLAVRRDVVGDDDAGVRVGERQPRAQRRVPLDREQPVRLARRRAARRRSRAPRAAARASAPVGAPGTMRSTSVLQNGTAASTQSANRASSAHRSASASTISRSSRRCPRSARTAARRRPAPGRSRTRAPRSDRKRVSFAGKRARRRGVERVALVEHDADLGRVREHELQLGRRARARAPRPTPSPAESARLTLDDDARLLVHARRPRAPATTSVYSPSCAASVASRPLPVEPTATTRPSNGPRRFAASRKKSTNPRRNAPVPNCTAFSGSVEQRRRPARARHVVHGPPRGRRRRAMRTGEAGATSQLTASPLPSRSRSRDSRASRCSSARAPTRRRARTRTGRRSAASIVAVPSSRRPALKSIQCGLRRGDVGVRRDLDRRHREAERRAAPRREQQHRRAARHHRRATTRRRCRAPRAA